MQTSYLLTIASDAVPVALIPLASVAGVLGVNVEQAAKWCETGQLRGTLHESRWWVSVAALTSFVQLSTWKLVAPPALPMNLRPGRAAR